MRGILFAFALLLPGCAAPACGPGLSLGTAIDLYLGGSVDAAAWRGFATDTLIAEFPDGSTTVAAEGTWLSRRQGRTIVEGSRVVTLIVPDARAAAPGVDRLVAAYKRRFDQDSVLRVERAVCFAF